MKKIIMSVLFILMTSVGIGITKVSDSELKQNNSLKEKEVVVEQEESKISSEEMNELKEESNPEIKDEEKSATTKQSESKSTSTQTKKDTNNSSNQTKQEITQSTQQVDEKSVQKEEPKQEEKVEEQKPSYIGVPNPNDLDYLVHHGVIQYKTYEECYNAGIELSFADSSVKSFWSYPVRDSQSTILGYYLYVERY